MNLTGLPRAPRSTRPLQATLAAVTAAAIALVIAPSPAAAITGDALEYTQNLTQSQTPVFAAVDPSVPLIESPLGRGSQLRVGSNTLAVPAPDAEVGAHATGALVRVTALRPSTALTISTLGGDGAGTPMLVAAAGATVSTTALLPVVYDVDSGTSSITLLADAKSEVRIEPLAYLRGDERAPGSTSALAESVRRADTAQQLGASALDGSAFWFGLTGEGGVPSEDVRAAYVALDVTLEAAGTLVISDGQRIDLPAGRSVFTTVVTPDEQGGAEVSLAGPGTGTGTGTGHIVADVTGWVAEAPAHSTSVNEVGSYVGITDGDVFTAEVSSHRSATSLAFSTHEDVAYGLALVSGSALTPSTQPTTALQWADQPEGRAQGIAVDAGSGIAPQLAFVPLESGTADLSIRQGGASVSIHTLGGFLGEAEHTANPDASISISSPAAGDQIDISGTGYFTIEGTAFSGSSAVDRIELSSPGYGFIGTAGLDYDGEQLNWYFDAAAPEDGEYTYVATLFDRGAPQTPRATVEITLAVDAPEDDEEVVAPNVRHFNTGQQHDFTVDPDDPRRIAFTADPDLLPGDLVISGATDATPEGFLGAVVAINRVDGVWIVGTREPGIDELVFQADIDETVDYPDGEGVSVISAAETAGAADELYTIESEFLEPVPAEITEPVSAEVAIDPESHQLQGGETALVSGVDNVDLVFDADNVPDGYEESHGAPVEFTCVDLSESDQEPQGSGIDDEGHWVPVGGAQSPDPGCGMLQGVHIEKSWSLKTEAKFLFQLKNGKVELEDQRQKTPEEIAASARAAFDKKIGMSIQLEAELLPHLIFKLEVKLKKKLGFIPTHVSVVEFRAEQNNSIRAQGSVSFVIALEWKLNLVKRLANIQLPTVTFMAGPVPIVITNKLDIGVSINAGIKGQVTFPLFGMSRSDNFGFSYASGRSVERIRNTGTVQYMEPEPEPAYTGARAELTGWITAGPTIEYASQIYGFAGPTLEFKAGPGIEGKITYADKAVADLTVYLGLELIGGAKLSILRYNLLNVKLFELNWKVVLVHREKVLSSGGASVSG